MSLRVVAHSASPETRTRVARATTAADSYLERLVKLVPGEALGAYPVLAAAAPEQFPWSMPLLAWLMLALVIFLRWQATRDPELGPQWPAVFIAAGSFVIYVYVMKGSFGIAQTMGYDIHSTDLQELTNFLTSVALVLWTIVCPVLYRGEN